MVGELHRMGFQLLRIAPYEYPLAWRCTVAPKLACSQINGAFVVEDMGQWPTYSSASENHYFGWRDAETDDARALAAKFIARFPEVVEAGKGRDWAYAGWLVELLGVLERHPGLMPIVVAEDFDTPPQRLTELPLRLYGDGSGSSALPTGFPLPPPGLAADSEVANVWDDFFQAPGDDLGEREQPEPQQREAL
jgi:hypothetical protein